MTKVTAITITPFWEATLKDQQKRYLEAVAAIEAEGVPFTDLVNSCCRSCAAAEGLFKTSEGGLGAWTFIGQEDHYKWLDGVLYVGEASWDEDYDEEGEDGIGEPKAPADEHAEPTSIFYSFASDIYVYFEDSDSASMRVPIIIIEAFKEAGFDVEWSGDVRKAPKIVFFK